MEIGGDCAEETRAHRYAGQELPHHHRLAQGAEVLAEKAAREEEDQELGQEQQVVVHRHGGACCRTPA
ncbi:MAG: hypothetical protein ACRD2T_11330, partial [Thermoanaerobaculia bacterium]